MTDEKLKVVESLNTEYDYNSNQNYERRYTREVKRYAKKYKITKEEAFKKLYKNN